LSATIYDIAKAAGVSIATVSRVFNNSEAVSDKTREKILKIAEQKGYHPKAFAQGLARRNSKLITAIVPIISNYFFMEVLAGIQDKLAEYDYDLNIYNIKSNVALSKQIEHVIRKGMGDGYLLISLHQQESFWETLKRYEVPIVLMDEYYHNFDSVSVDSIGGAYTATQHFIKAGCKRISMISARPEAKPSHDRILGFKKAHIDTHKNLDESLIVTGNDMERDGFTVKAGYEAMVKLINMKPQPDACFCTSDIQALGALKAMKDHHFYLPLIGFDDLQISEYLGLSTMHQPMYEMGSLVIEKLMNRLQNPNTSVSHTVFSPELILRGTTAKNVSEKIV
jgi:LacI family transcriptional regulator